MAIQPLNIVSNLRAVKGERQSPIVVQGDTLRDLSVSILDGTDLLTNAELVQFTTIAITYTPSYGQSVMHIGQVSGDSILFPIGTLEANVVGLVKASIQLYQADGRVSTLSFPLEVLRDEAGFFYAPNAYEQTLIQSVLVDGPVIINSALTAAIEADESRDAAYLAEGIALSAAEVADLAALNADAKAVFAQTQGEFAQAQGNFAQGAGNFVQAEVDRAVAQGNVAEAKGNVADGQGDVAQAQGEDAATKAALAAAKTAETEAVRFATEAERIATEAKRIQTESVRLATEAERLLTLAERNSTNAVKSATETERINTAAVRVATETERLNTASERLATAAERLATSAVKTATDVARTDYLAVRDSVIAERQLSEANRTNLTGRMTTVEGVAATAKTTADLAKARADLIIGQAGTSNTEIVDSRLGADLVARATSGELIREIHAALIETARQTTTLNNGVAVVSGGVDALAETEIEGRTLISLANSNMEANKQYVVADKKTKLIVDGITQSGVAKFTKGTTTVSTANYLNKVAGSNVANPHKFSRYGVGTPSGLTPSMSVENAQSNYDNIKTLDGGVYTYTATTNGNSAMVTHSFDIIQEIERKLGIIPKSTLADKVQWVKDNVSGMIANWHGFGSSVGGNKASLIRYTTTWLTAISHTNGTVTNIAYGLSEAQSIGIIQADGFAHFLAYAEPSDGVTPSSISTDYIDLVVTLKATAQLNTRPTIIRVENFEGKISGSVVENAHLFKRAGASTLLIPSSTAFTENDTSMTTGISKLDGGSFVKSEVGNGVISQHLFSYNLIEAVERNVGKIPRTSVADKVQWLKENVARIISSWHGFGSSVGGNKATFSVWKVSDSTWTMAATHANGVVSRLQYGTGDSGTIATRIDANGFVHLLAHADASDGVTASTINTDYIDLEIELRSTADFTRPKVALYEVTADSYAKILVDWSADEVVNRYPSVEGVQHLQGVGVIAEGENLLPPFSDAVAIPSSVVINSAYEIILNPTSAYQGGRWDIPVSPNTTYTLSAVFDTVGMYIDGNFKDANNVTIGTGTGSINQAITSKTFVTPPNTVKLAVNFVNSAGAGAYKFKNPMLNLGNVAKPFVPRNPSYLFADVKLGAIGTVADRLYEQDGSKFVRKVVEKDVVLDGSLAWVFGLDYVGHKRFTLPFAQNVLTATSSKFNGLNLKLLDAATLVNGASVMDSFGSGNVNRFDIVVSDNDTGFGETFTPSPNEIKAYFYGYKMNNGTYGVNYDGTGTKTWTPIGDTTNARAVTVVPTSASPTQLDGTIQPYKLSYVLATPQIVNVTDKVEGSLKVNGLTQVEALSGIVRREKVVPYVYGNGKVYLNDFSIGVTSQYLKNKTLKILDIYKNGIKDTARWQLATDMYAYGKQRAEIPQANYDQTAEYTVTYIALDKPLLTANPTNIKLLYANNMRSSLEDTVGKVQDNTTQLSVHEKAIIDLYIRVKALGG